MVNAVRAAEVVKPEGLTPQEEAERATLIEAELLASARRTAALADAVGRCRHCFSHRDDHKGFN